jgi:uncharacterized protein YndB with AHSA1/START domain
MDMITETATRADDATLCIERLLAAPRELVFAAWTEPRHLRRWSAPHGFDIPLAEGDLRPGGGWRAAMRGPDGTEHRLVGTYREILPPERLVFTHAWIGEDGRPGPQTLVTVTFEAVGDSTLMRFTQTGFDSRAARDGHGGGWTEAFERLEACLAAEA